MKRLAFPVALAVCLLVLGLVLGGPYAVWQKAANLCMECIGLG
ncbi:MAG: CD1871A family CXXC motif-containing protein [Sphaerochaetaceae bacterium]|nr:CD1871A family CXXC motif-containing protein [Spirochaetales bacterium]MDY5499017.1 CD1871A family CXXC motif-containing protein [Sphaerochaetaceae bacterium]